MTCLHGPRLSMSVAPARHLRGPAVSCPCHPSPAVPAETNLQWGEVVVDQECQNSRGNNEELHPESVMVSIISSFELAVDHPHRGKGTSYVDHLRGTDRAAYRWGLPSVGSDTGKQVPSPPPSNQMSRPSSLPSCLNA